MNSFFVFSLLCLLYSFALTCLLFPLEFLINYLSQFSSVAQSCPIPCDPMNCSTLGLPVHQQLPEFTQTHVHQVSDAIQPSFLPRTPRTDLLQNGLVGSPCSPRDSQESSPASQFKSINSLALSFLHSPTLTSIHDHWKNHSLD